MQETYRGIRFALRSIGLDHWCWTIFPTRDLGHGEVSGEVIGRMAEAMNAVKQEIDRQMYQQPTAPNGA
jgi:hypothetical protein